jgi:hypothetical protein
MNYPPNVGAPYVFIDGTPGSGKSQFGHTLMAIGLNRGYCGIMRGTAPCEWRHYLGIEELKGLTIKLFVPLGYKKHIFFDEFPQEIIDTIIEVDYEELDLEQYVKPKTLLVIYDECFNMSQKCWLITDLLSRLRYRHHHGSNKITLVYLEHEAGTIFPMRSLAPKDETVSNKHWHAVNAMCHILVDFRKYKILPIFIAQLSTEFIDLMRDKCIYKIYRRGKASSTAPISVKKRTPFHSIEKYTIVLADGIYLPDQKIPYFPEIKEQWSMIPNFTKRIKYTCLQERLSAKTEKPSKDNLTPRECLILRERLNNTSWRKIAKMGQSLYNLSGHHSVYVESMDNILVKLDAKISKMRVIMQS